MTDRVYPSAKPAASNPPRTLNGSAFPAPKSQLYNPTRQPYRPTPKPRRRRRSCCFCCIWFIICILALILLAAIAAGVVWVLYRPQRPSFSVSSLKFTSFNLTTASTDSTPTLNSHLDVSVSARNPNKKLVFFYDPIFVTVSSEGFDIGNGSFPSFTHATKNTTTLRTSVPSGGPRDLDSASAISIRSDLKKKNRLPLEVRFETKVRVKMGGLKTNKVGISVFCNGIDANIPKGNSTATPFSDSSSDPNCEVKLRVKIWKWQI